jgi:hypothetical protein
MAHITKAILLTMEDWTIRPQTIDVGHVDDNTSIALRSAAAASAKAAAASAEAADVAVGTDNIDAILTNVYGSDS